LAPPTDPKRARSILAYIRTASSMSIHMLINDYHGAASCGGYETFVTMSIGRNVAEVCCLLLRSGGRRKSLEGERPRERAPFFVRDQWAQQNAWRPLERQPEAESVSTQRFTMCSIANGSSSDDHLAIAIFS
jgi:hypothetical protein